MKKIVIVSVALLSSSCIATYTPPPGTPTAKFRFVAESENYFVLPRVRDGARCATLGIIGPSRYLKQEYTQKKEPEMMLDFNEPDTRKGEREIGAGVPIELDIQGISPTPGGCNVTFQFTPIPDAQYEVIYNGTDFDVAATAEYRRTHPLDKNTFIGSCNISVRRLVRTDAKVTRESIPDIKQTKSRACM